MSCLDLDPRGLERCSFCWNGAHKSLGSTLLYSSHDFWELCPLQPSGGNFSWRILKPGLQRFLIIVNIDIDLCNLGWTIYSNSGRISELKPIYTLEHVLRMTKQVLKILWKTNQLSVKMTLNVKSLLPYWRTISKRMLKVMLWKVQILFFYFFSIDLSRQIQTKIKPRPKLDHGFG